MPRNGTGKYVLPPGINPVKPGTVIATNWANSTLDDMATALSASLTADGQKAWSGSQNANGHQVKNLSTPVDPGDAMPFGYAMANFATAGNISGWDRPADHIMPSISQSGETSVFVPGGTGWIIDPISGKLQVVWSGNIVPLTGISTSWATTIGVNVSGEIVQLPGSIDPEWARSNVILGYVTHISGEIDSISNNPSVFGELPYASYDLMMGLRNTTIDGCVVYPSTTEGLNLAITAGTKFLFGGSPNNLNSQNYVDVPAQDGLAMFPVTGNSSVGEMGMAIPVTKYNPGGGSSVEDIPGGPDTSTIFRLFQLGDSYILMYGQNTYPDLNAAKLGLYSEPVVIPSKLSNATFLAFIAVRKSATDLSDPQDSSIVSPGGGGGTGQGGSPLVVQTITSNTLVNGGNSNLLLVSTSPSPILVVLKNRATGSSFVNGDTISVLQKGEGQVTVQVEDSEGSLTPSKFFLNATRGQGCTVTAACIYADGDEWSMSGDLAPGPEMELSGPAGDTVWYDAVLAGGWVAVAGDRPQYSKDSAGFVNLRGSATVSGTFSGLVTSLPAGYRPAAAALLPAVGDGMPHCTVAITDVGDVVIHPFNGNSPATLTTNSSLHGVRFYVGW